MFKFICYKNLRTLTQVFGFISVISEMKINEIVGFGSDSKNREYFTSVVSRKKMINMKYSHF